MKRRRFLQSLGVGAGGLVVAGGGALAVPAVQRLLTYSPTKRLDGTDVEPIKAPDEYGLEGITAEKMETTASEDFTVWRSATLEPCKKTVVIFPGNFGHLGDGREKAGDENYYVSLIQKAQAEGYQIIAANHVGFADSTVEPTEAGIFRGAEKTIAWALEQGLSPDDLKLYGISMGTTVAAHAASSLAANPKFVRDPEQSQKIRLLMASGVINAGVVLDDILPPVVSDYANAVWQEELNTGKELQKMGRSQAKDRIFVSNLRGLDDELTPPDQGAAHEQAAKGLNFTHKEVAGKHFIAPEIVLSELKALEEMKAPEVQRVGPGG